MRKNTLPQSIDVLHKIETIEERIVDLKLSVLRKLPAPKKKPLSLKGILKGITISDSDIEEAKKSLYSSKVKN
ncbi:MAG: hypothetical protein FJ266_16395 [Planctomycetes bacterium]|nr:hypothetical protein [Planctomycetota bacterium]